MPNIKKFPPIDKGLLETLIKLFPDMSPDIRWSDKEVWFKAGQSSVIRFLRAKFEEQNETVIEDK